MKNLNACLLLLGIWLLPVYRTVHVTVLTYPRPAVELGGGCDQKSCQ